MIPSSGPKSRLLPLLLRPVSVCLPALFAIAACQPSGGGEAPVPTVTFTCASKACDAAPPGLSNAAFVVYVTQSGCDDLSFATRFSGGGFVTCDGSRCSGSVDTWVSGNSETPVTSFPRDTYDFCAVIFFNGGPNSGPLSGDAVGTNENVNYTGANTKVNILNWSDRP